jgi:hypothetical protein
MLELPEVDVMPEQYEWGLWFSSQQNWLNHTYVYRRDMDLQAGTTYHFQTRNLGSGWFGRPDPVMYLVRGNEIVEFNDDYTGLASEIIYTPTVTGTHRVVVRAFTTSTPGFCDVYMGEGGAPPTLLDSQVTFGGTYVRARWKPDEWFETGHAVLGYGGLVSRNPPAVDPYLFLIYPQSAKGSKMYWDDDGAGNLHSKIVPPSGGTGAVILGSYSRYTEGQCLLGLVGQSYKAPWTSPGPWASLADPVTPSPAVAKYIEELERRKPALRKLSPGERDQSVLELQRTMLPEEEIRRQHAPEPSASTELVRRQEDFLGHYRQLEQDLEGMSFDERAAKLAHVKRETMGREYSEPEEPPLPEYEAASK